MKPFLRLAAAAFLVATALGVVLRVAFVIPIPSLNFQFALHAHSHTLYFGWAALGFIALAFHRLGANDVWVRALLASISVIAAASFVSFLLSGYSTASIIISSLSLIVWSVAVGLFFRRARGRRAIDLSFLRVAFCYVAVAGIFALGRVGLLVAKADPLYGRLAVFGFLHAFAAFFIFSSLGLLIHRAPALGWSFNGQRLRVALGVMAPLYAFTFPLGVAGAGELPLSDVASVIAVLLVAPQFLIARELWRGPAALRLLAVLFGAKAVMEGAGGLGLAELAAQLRHPAIAYLHVVLVGFVSGALVLLLRSRFGRAAGQGFWWHQAGLGVMCVGLLASVPDATQRLGLVAAAVGGALIVVGALLWAPSLLSSEVDHRREHADGPAHAVG